MAKIPKSQLLVFLLIALASGVYLFNYEITESYLNNESTLAAELKSPPDSSYLFRIKEVVPFKYRLLFPKVIHYTWVAVRNSEHDNETFVVVYRTWMYLLYLGSALSLYALLKVIGFTMIQAFAGGFIFILLPAMSFAFTFPVHTREDLLGYILLDLALIFLLRGKTGLYLLTAVVGVLCRETLLVSAVVFFLFSKEKFLIRAVVASVPMLVWVVMRWSMGVEKYDVFGMGLTYNLEYLFDSIAFLFMVFNALWLLTATSIMFEPKPALANMRIMFGSAIPVFFLVLISTFFLGRIEEIRLLYLLAPWMISITLYSMVRHKNAVIRYLKSALFIYFFIAAVALPGITYFAVWLVRPQTYSILDLHWWVVLFLSIVATVASLPLLQIISQPGLVQTENSSQR